MVTMSATSTSTFLWPGPLGCTTTYRVGPTMALCNERDVLEAFRQTNDYRRLVRSNPQTRDRHEARDGGRNLEFDHIMLSNDGSDLVFIEVKFLDHHATGPTARVRRTKKRKEVEEQVDNRVEVPRPWLFSFVSFQYLHRRPDAFGQSLTRIRGFTLVNEVNGEFSFDLLEDLNIGGGRKGVRAEEEEGSSLGWWALGAGVLGVVGALAYGATRDNRDDDDQ